MSSPDWRVRDVTRPKGGNAPSSLPFWRRLEEGGAENGAGRGAERGGRTSLQKAWMERVPGDRSKLEGSSKPQEGIVRNWKAARNHEGDRSKLEGSSKPQRGSFETERRQLETGNRIVRVSFERVCGF